MYESHLQDCAVAINTAYGWNLFPIGHDKKPIPKWTPLQRIKQTPEDVRKLFGRYRGIEGIGVVHGSISGGYVIRDFDTLAGYYEWSEAYPAVAGTLPTVRTKRGYHVCFNGPGVCCRKGAMPIPDRLGPPGEYRANMGCYSQVPPSQHDEGCYEWLIAPPAKIPYVRDPVLAGLYPVELAEDFTTGRQYRVATQRPLPGQSPSTGKSPAADQLHPSPSNPTRHKRIECVTSDLVSEVEVILSRTVPEEPGTRHRRLFLLARGLKMLPVTWAKDELVQILAEWFARGWVNIRTKDFSITEREFWTAWENVVPSQGEQWLVDSFRNRFPHEPLANTRYDDPVTRPLVRLCDFLQRHHGNAPFFLSCRMAADLLGVNYMTIQRRFLVLMKDEVLFRVQQGRYKTRMATTWRFVDREL